MTIDTSAVLQLVAKLAEEDGLKTTVKESLKGGMICGTGATIGGMIGGPLGMAVGGAGGAFIAAFLAQGKFKSVAEVILEMEPKHQRALVEEVTRILNKLDATDMITVASLVMGNYNLRTEVLSTAVGYLRKELKLEILD